MQPEFFAVVVAVLGVSVAINGFFVRSSFVELRALQEADRRREVDLAIVTERVDALTGRAIVAGAAH